MDQQTIDKLMEIKKLYEAGILTKDEMEAEKNKVLHPEGIMSEEPKAEEPVSEEIPSDATPVMTDSEGRFVFDVPKKESIQTNSSSTQQPSQSNTKLYWIGGIGILVFIIVLLSISNKKNDAPTYFSEESMTAVDSVSYDEPVLQEESVIEEEAEEVSVWEGNYEILGEMYRLCLTSARFDLRPLGDGSYTGDLSVKAGYDSNDWSYGELCGVVTGTSIGNEISLKISKIHIYGGKDESVFDNGSYKMIDNGDVIFKLSTNGGTYHVQPIGAMKDYFDGITCDVTITKK